MQELQKAEFFGPTLIWPAVAVQDFVMAEGTLTLETGEKSAGLDMALTPNSGSSNPTPNGSAWLSLMPLKVHRFTQNSVWLTSPWFRTQAVFSQSVFMAEPLNLLLTVKGLFTAYITPD
ncbi:uncharacterized protein LOC132130132 isoform X1 [Carassius carassius]|uniref:uncharacterized protein LOC132130132 isoform X1 n=1 Tax=Carassius carassius TaxID=217509 RepID=UPI00286910D5|nr:uncharacterized protein LOC132130132 isoform X1 [Carassius carassius]